MGPASLHGGDKKAGDDAQVYLDTVDTYGIGCASYYWGRLGAMATRTIHYILGWDYMCWLLLFADDGKMSCSIRKFQVAIPVALFFISAMGFPIKWSRCHGGTEYQWIGYSESVKPFTLGTSESGRSTGSEESSRWRASPLRSSEVDLGDLVLYTEP